MIDLTPIFQALITLAVALITAFVIPWLKRKIGSEKMSEFLKWVDIAVKAAEQLYSTTEGDKKKLYVVQFLSDKGFKVDTATLDSAIEAAVLELHNDLYAPIESTPALEAGTNGN